MNVRNHACRRFVPSALVAMLLSPVCAQSQGPHMTFRCSFDGTVEPQVHTGSAAAGLEGQAEYVPGLAGKALVVGDGKAQLKYAVPGNYSLKESTVSFWVKPVDWRGDDKHFHIFFQAAASFPGGRGCGARLLYKYLVPGRFLHLAIPDDPIPYVNFQGACYADIADWKPDEWHHVVGTWRGAGMGLYLDGKPVAGQPYSMMPMNMGSEFLFGDRTWGKGRDARSLVDELTIYDSTLNEAEVALLFRRYRPAAAQPGQLPIVLRPFFLSRRLEIYADTWGMDQLGSLRASLHQGEQKLASASCEPTTNSGLVRVTLSLDGIAPGEYTVNVAAQGKAGHRSGSATLAVPADPPWLGSKVGVSAQVPPPWTDMAQDNGTVTCWNRRYELAPGPLPKQIVSAGEPILAGPVELRVEAGEEALVWQSRQWQVKESEATHVTFAASASARNVRLRVDGRIEYDGMAWFDTQLTDATGTLDVDRVALEIPLRSSVVDFYQGILPRTIEKHAGEVPKGDGRAFAQAFMPALWVGSDDRGLQWFTESSEPWDDPRRADSIQIVRRGDVALLRVEPIASGRKLKSPWRFAFGLQASPVRPVVPDWRRLRLSGAPGTAYLIWTNPKEMIWFGYPQARDPKALKAKIAGMHKRRVTVVPYSCPFLFPLDCPESKLYGVEWVRLGEGDSGSADVVRMGGCAQYVPPSSPHYMEFTLWAHERFVREIGWDGLYFDHSTVKALDFEPAGCGYVRDGVRMPTYPMRATREMLKRMYVMLKTLSPDNWLMIHTSGRATLPLHGFADIRALGEDLGMRLSKKPNYHDILTEAEWRAIQCGHAYGFSNVMLPKLPSRTWEDPVPTEQLMGLILLYNTDLWGGYSHGPSRGAMRRACDRFGIIAARFTPFWQKPPLVKATAQSVRVSVYQQPGRAMLVLVNKSTDAVTTRVTFDAARLGLKPNAPWHDLLTDEPLNPDAALDLRPGNYRLVQIGAK